PGGPAGGLLRPPVLVDVRRRGAAVVGPGNQHLIGGVSVGVDHLAHPVVDLRRTGLERPVYAPGDQRRQAQQAQQALFPQGRRGVRRPAGMDVPGAAGAEGGLLRQSGPTVGTDAFQIRSPPYSKTAWAIASEWPQRLSMSVPLPVNRQPWKFSVSSVG